MNVATIMHNAEMHRTTVEVDVTIEHRFAVGDVVERRGPEIPGYPDIDNVSIWRILEVGFDHHRGSWYRMAPENEIARFDALEAHGRVARTPTELIKLMGPVTEYIRTVDNQCQPHVQ